VPLPVSIRVRGERTGSPKYRNLGESQSVLILINAIISPCTCIDVCTPVGIVHRCMVSPNNPTKMAWDQWVIGPLCVYVAIVVPLRLGFSIDICPGDVEFVIDFLVDMLFLADIFLQLRTGYYDEKNNMKLVLKAQLARRRYFGGWFWFDVASVLPTLVEYHLRVIVIMIGTLD
jgi:hypothetical protein